MTTPFPSTATSHIPNTYTVEYYAKISKENLNPIRRVQVLAIRWLLHLAGYSDRQIAKITGAD